MEHEDWEEYRKNLADCPSDDELSEWSSMEDDESESDRIKDLETIGKDSEFTFSHVDGTSGFFGVQDHTTNSLNNMDLWDNDEEPSQTFHSHISAGDDMFYSLNLDQANLMTDIVPFTHFPHSRLFEIYSLFQTSQKPTIGGYRVVTPYIRMIKQDDLIREIFNMMRGLEGSVFKLTGFSKDTFDIVHSDLSVSFLSKTALHNTLQYFVDISSAMQKIYVKSMQSSMTIKSVVLQSYYSTISAIITEIRNELSSIERRNQLGTITDDGTKSLSLFTLKTLTFQFEIRINSLNNIDREITEVLDGDFNLSDSLSEIISSLYDKITRIQYMCMENNYEYDYTFRVLQSLLKPYLSIMDSWVFEGLVRDNYNEFMLKRNEQVNIETPLFWTEGFNHGRIPTIISSLKDKICNLGQSIIIVKDIEQKYDITASSYIRDYLIDTDRPTLYELLQKTLSVDSSYRIETLYNEPSSPNQEQASTTTSKKRENSNSLEKSLNTPISPPIGSVNFQRSPPKKKRMLSLKDKTNLYNQVSQMDSFFTLKPNMATKSNLNNLFKKKMLFEVIDMSKEESKYLYMKPSLPIEISFDVGLLKNITEQYNRVSPYLCDLIVKQCNLLDHLTAIRAIFLMEAGDIMDFFATKLFQLSDRFFAFDFRGITSFDIQIILRDAFRLGTEYPRTYSFSNNDSTLTYNTDVFSTIKLDQIMSVRLDETSIKSSEGNFFDSLSFSYELGWPLNLIISNQHVHLYNEVLIFNLKLKQSKQVLDVMSLKNDAFIYGSKVYSKFFLVLTQLKHFIGTVQYYMMNRVLHALWNELCENILSAKDLNELRNFHQDYVNKIRDRFLLKKAQFVKNHIFKVVQLSISLKYKLDNFKQSQREDILLAELEEIEAEFKKSFKMLLTIINSILTRGMHEHCKCHSQFTNIDSGGSAYQT